MTSDRLVIVSSFDIFVDVTKVYFCDLPLNLPIDNIIVLVYGFHRLHLIWKGTHVHYS